MVEAIEDKGGRIFPNTKIHPENGNVRSVQVASDGRADEIGCDLLINSALLCTLAVQRGVLNGKGRRMI